MHKVRPPPLRNSKRASGVSVALLFCLLIALTTSAAAEGTHAYISEYTGAETCLA